MVDWNGLLKWTLKQQAEDTTNTTHEVKPMSKEDMKWLEEAMESYCVNEMKEVIKILNDLKEKDESDDLSDIKHRCDLLDKLLCYIDGPEISRNIVRAKRFGEIIKYFFSTNHKTIRIELANILTSMMQNDQYIQEAAIDLGIFNYLKFLNESDDDELSSKYIYILTGLLYGESAKPKRMFLEDYDGMKLIYNLLIKNKNNSKSLKRVIGLINELTRKEDKLNENYQTRYIAVEKIKEIEMHTILLNYLDDTTYSEGDHTQTDIRKDLLTIIENIIILYNTLDDIFKVIEILDKKISETVLPKEQEKEEKEILVEAIKTLKGVFGKDDYYSAETISNSNLSTSNSNTEQTGMMLINIKK